MSSSAAERPARRHERGGTTSRTCLSGGEVQPDAVGTAEAVLPGITGWAQRERAQSITWEKRIERDLDNVERMSFFMDVRILVRTLPAILATGNQIADRDFFKDPTTSRN